MGSDLLLYVVVATALAFDFTNGFHDTANAMATSIATHALRPRVAVALASVLNLVGAFISIAVALTIAKGIVETADITLAIVFAGLCGAIIWNLITWAFQLPSSSSHGLIGGIVGATLAAVGTGAVKFGGIVENVLIPALIAPFLAGLIAALGTLIAYRITRHAREDQTSREDHAAGEEQLSGPDRTGGGFRVAQIGSASLVALAHGTNDAQKTMGVITLALVAHGTISAHDVSVPLWVKAAAALAISAGTFIGGWRIIQTLGSRVTDIEPPQGFAAETAGGATILASSFFGYPLSTTHVVGGAVMGAGVGKGARVQWRLVGQIMLAWLLTLPAAALIGAAAYELTSGLGGGDTGPITVAALLAMMSAAIYFSAQHFKPVHSKDV
jgi:PiT family inorganic phosphate transporter